MTNEQVMNLVKNGNTIFYVRGHKCIIQEVYTSLPIRGSTRGTYLFKMRYLDNSAARIMIQNHYNFIPDGGFHNHELTEWVNANQLMCYEPNDILMEIL